MKTMRCPFCGHEEDRVLDTRSIGGGRAIRRRRECLRCSRRFTTYEEVEDFQLMVVKKDQRREAFDRSKVLNGLKAACQKRPISAAVLETITEDIERTLYNQPRKEAPAAEIGEMVMDHLRNLDPVAYVRFASVYRAFQDPAQFRELVDLLAAARNNPSGPVDAGEIPTINHEPTMNQQAEIVSVDKENDHREPG